MLQNYIDYPTFKTDIRYQAILSLHSSVSSESVSKQYKQIRMQEQVTSAAFFTLVPNGGEGASSDQKHKLFVYGYSQLVSD